MNDAAAKPALAAAAGAFPGEACVSIGQIFFEFFILGTTSFGGVVPYLRCARGLPV